MIIKTIPESAHSHISWRNSFPVITTENGIPFCDGMPFTISIIVRQKKALNGKLCLDHSRLFLSIQWAFRLWFYKLN